MSQEFVEGIPGSSLCCEPVLLFLTSTGSIWEGKQKVTLGVDTALHNSYFKKADRVTPDQSLMPEWGSYTRYTGTWFSSSGIPLLNTQVTQECSLTQLIVPVALFYFSMSCAVTVKLPAIEFPIKILKTDSCCLNTPSPYCCLGICISPASYPFQTSVFGSEGTQTPSDALLTWNLHVTTVFFIYSSPRLIQGSKLLLRPMLILPLQWKWNHWQPISWFLRGRLKVAVRWLSPAQPPQQWEWPPGNSSW